MINKNCDSAFTLAEVLITLAIIGIVAALTIPGVIANYQQQEYKTGLKKAVSALNQAITLGLSEGDSPYYNANLFGYLAGHMSVLKTTTNVRYQWHSATHVGDGVQYFNNAAFYTTDGMRFEFSNVGTEDGHNIGAPLYEDPGVQACWSTSPWVVYKGGPGCGGCGSLGLDENGAQKPPCIIVADVNGDRKPTPSNINCTHEIKGTCYNDNNYKITDPTGNVFTDVFTILITENRAIPYGVMAQRAMYGGR